MKSINETVKATSAIMRQYRKLANLAQGNTEMTELCNRLFELVCEFDELADLEANSRGFEFAEDAAKAERLSAIK